MRRHAKSLSQRRKVRRFRQALRISGSRKSRTITHSPIAGSVRRRHAASRQHHPQLPLHHTGLPTFVARRLPENNDLMLTLDWVESIMYAADLQSRLLEQQLEEVRARYTRANHQRRNCFVMPLCMKMVVISDVLRHYTSRIQECAHYLSLHDPDLQTD